MYDTMSTEADSSFDGLYRGAMVDGKKNLTSSPSTFSSVVYVINIVIGLWFDILFDDAPNSGVFSFAKNLGVETPQRGS